MKKITIVCLAFASVTTMAGTAAAEDLGAEEQFVISSDLQLSFTRTSYNAPEGATDPDSVTSILIQPALDYFVMDNLSLGGVLAYETVSEGDIKASGFGILPRVGYAIPVNEGVVFWPRLAVGYKQINREDPPRPDRKTKKIILSILAPFAIHPTEHFFIGIGPIFSMDLSSKVGDSDGTKEMGLGVTTQVGGYF